MRRVQTEMGMQIFLVGYDSGAGLDCSACLVRSSISQVTDQRYSWGVVWWLEFSLNCQVSEVETGLRFLDSEYGKV